MVIHKRRYNPSSFYSRGLNMSDDNTDLDTLITVISVGTVIYIGSKILKGIATANIQETAPATTPQSISNNSSVNKSVPTPTHFELYGHEFNCCFTCPYTCLTCHPYTYQCLTCAND